MYLSVLESEGASASALADALSLSARRVRSALDTLEASSLLNRSTVETSRFFALPPGVALDALIRRRQEALDQARTVARRLEERFRDKGSRTRPEDLVAVVVNREAIAERVAQIQRGATKEILGFDRPPYLSGENPIEIENLRRGVRYRVLYDQSALTDATPVFQRIAEFVSAGEDARTFKGVPMKLIIADRRVALIPLNIEEPDRVGVLLLQSSTLLDALTALWETLWRLGAPLRLTRSKKAPLEPGDRPLSDQDQRILGLLVAGLKPEAIARRLDLGPSTVDRRINRMMEMLGANTRFQAGILAVRRGWVEPAREA